MANRNIGFVDIDGAKLKDAIKAKEYKMTDLSLKIGKGSTFLTESCKRNTIDPTAYKFICSICGLRCMNIGILKYHRLCLTWCPMSVCRVQSKN